MAGPLKSWTSSVGSDRLIWIGQATSWRSLMRDEILILLFEWRLWYHLGLGWSWVSAVSFNSCRFWLSEGSSGCSSWVAAGSSCEGLACTGLGSLTSISVLSLLCVWDVRGSWCGSVCSVSLGSPFLGFRCSFGGSSCPSFDSVSTSCFVESVWSMLANRRQLSLPVWDLFSSECSNEKSLTVIRHIVRNLAFHPTGSNLSLPLLFSDEVSWTCYKR